MLASIRIAEETSTMLLIGLKSDLSTNFSARATREDDLQGRRLRDTGTVLAARALK